MPRGGYSLVELTIAVLIVAILAGIGVPSYQHVMYKARAAKMLRDFQTVRTAAHQYRADFGEWPDDVGRATLPAGLEPYVTDLVFSGRGYVLDWDNWDVSDGTLVGVTAFVEEAPLQAALLEALGGSSAQYLRLGDNRYMYILEAPAP